MPGFGDDRPQFWIGTGEPCKGRLHVAFAAKDRAGVRAFYEAAIAAGGMTTARQDCDRIIMRTTTGRSLSIPTGTISKPLPTFPSELD